MTPAQRMRMRRFEVVCERAVARLQGRPETDVQDVVAHSRVLPLRPRRAQYVFMETIVIVGDAIARALLFERLLVRWARWRQAR